MDERKKDDYKKYYDIIEEIGKGAYGSVYKGKVKLTNELRAIKVIDLDIIKQNLLEEYEIKDIKIHLQFWIDKFKNEYENMKKCSKSDNSVKCYEYFDNNKNFVIIMELCDVNLSQLLMKNLEKYDRGFSVEEIYEIMTQLNNALKIMKNNNIIHRDLKLENILVKFIDKEHKKYQVKLTDYGCSVSLNSLLSINVLHSFVGTIIYMAPELLKKEEYNYKCDLWSLGIIIYKLYFGKSPFSGITEEALTRNIVNFRANNFKKIGNKDLDDLLKNLLEKEKEKRLNWDKYFNHPFFRIKDKNIINENVQNYQNNKINFISEYKNDSKENCKIKKGDIILGKGDFSTVYLGTKENPDGKIEKIALKEIPKELDNEESQKALDNEIDICQRLDNTNIVKLIKIEKNIDDKVYLVYEFCNGGDLRRYMDYFKTFDEELIQIIMIKMINALIELSRKKVVHHNIKPENILVQLFPDEEMTPEIEKIIDEIKKATNKNHIQNNNQAQNNYPNQNNNNFMNNNMYQSPNYQGINNNFLVNNQFPINNNQNNINNYNIPNNNYNINNNFIGNLYQPNMNFQYNNNLNLINSYNNINYFNSNNQNNNKKEKSMKKSEILKILKRAQFKLSGFRLSKSGTININENKELFNCVCPLYMAPELFLTGSSLRYVEDQKVDIWALGVVAFEMFFGRKPFEAKSLKEINKLYKIGEYYINSIGPNNIISKEFVEFINLCLQKLSKERADVYCLQKTDFYNIGYQSLTEMNEVGLLKSLGNAEKEEQDIILRIDEKYYKQSNEEDEEQE